MNYRYDLNGTLVAVSRSNLTDGSSSILFAQTNTRGDVVSLYNSSGVVKVNYVYDSWGKLISATDESGNALAENSVGALNAIRYRGYVYDSETGFYYLQSRYYDPETGRFLNADDVDYIGASGSVLGYNAFAYCENNAVNNVDSQGTAFSMFVSMAIGAFLGALGLYMMDVVYNLLMGYRKWWVPCSSTVDYISAAVSGALSMISFKKISTILSGAVSGVTYILNQWTSGKV